MANNTIRDTSRIGKNDIAQEIESMKVMADAQRKQFARTWYDNNFFDDGYHFGLFQELPVESLT